MKEKHNALRLPFIIHHSFFVIRVAALGCQFAERDGEIAGGAF